MAVTHQGVFVQLPKITPQSFVNADGTNKKTVATAGSDGSKLVALIATSTDTANRVASIYLTRSATSYLLGSVAIPLASGSDGSTAGINLLSSSLIPGLPVDNDGQTYIFLESGDTLQVAMQVAVTAAKEIDVLAVFGNF